MCVIQAQRKGKTCGPKTQDPNNPTRGPFKNIGLNIYIYRSMNAWVHYGSLEISSHTSEELDTLEPDVQRCRIGGLTTDHR